MGRGPILHWVNEDQSEEYGGDLTNISGAPSEGDSPGIALGVVGGRRSVHPSMASSLGDGSVTSQEASQLANGDYELVTDTAARQLGDVVGTCRVTSQRVNADGAPTTEPAARQLDDGSLTGQGAAIRATLRGNLGLTPFIYG